ncbi:hypothetical protein [Micromonospora sp. L31]|uniref:hypothetical protein n=1 Tax=Micromonospora sp. L31 TaxID=3452213 RepID=UPI003F8A7463
MTDEDLTLPAVLVEAHTAGFFHEHSGHDFDPYDTFMWSGEMVEWWQNWTNDPMAGAPPFRAFGQDGTGGLAAFWLRNPGDPLDRQSVVFLGSEASTPSSRATLAIICGCRRTASARSRRSTASSACPSPSQR